METTMNGAAMFEDRRKWLADARTRFINGLRKGCDGMGLDDKALLVILDEIIWKYTDEAKATKDPVQCMVITGFVLTCASAAVEIEAQEIGE